MDNRQAMIEKLLEGLSILEQWLEPPEQIAPQFQAWLVHVTSALESAGMVSELKVWQESCQNISYFPDESSFPLQMSSMKAILMGILEKVSGGQTSDELFPLSLVDGTPKYIRRIAEQANGCYGRGWYDSCAVMLRRLIETLIIECFEKFGIEQKITDNTGGYLRLGDLITSFLSEKAWHVSRHSQSSLPKLREIKDLGDMSAHSRRFIAVKRDIDKYAQDFRVVLQELVYISEK